MQTVLVIVSFPQAFRTIIEMLYVPGAVKETPKLVDPQEAGLFVGFGFPTLPEATLHPDAGEIVQLLLFSRLHCRFVPTSIPLMEVFVNVSVEFVQATLLGEMVKFAAGFVEVVIGSTVDSENPQGFSALILMKNEFGLFAPVTPQEDAVKVCV